MTWKGGPLNQHRWSGPHRVIIQDDHHTVWCTSHGKLIRSAPENTRRSLPEEGSPEGPELPADITPMTQKIARMNQTDSQSTEFQEITLDIPNELDNQDVSSNHPSHTATRPHPAIRPPASRPPVSCVFDGITVIVLSFLTFSNNLRHAPAWCLVLCSFLSQAALQHALDAMR